MNALAAWFVYILIFMYRNLYGRYCIWIEKITWFCHYHKIRMSAYTVPVYIFMITSAHLHVHVLIHIKLETNNTLWTPSNLPINWDLTNELSQTMAKRNYFNSKSNTITKTPPNDVDFFNFIHIHVPYIQ